MRKLIVLFLGAMFLTACESEEVTKPKKELKEVETETKVETKSKELDLPVNAKIIEVAESLQIENVGGLIVEEYLFVDTLRKFVALKALDNEVIKVFVNDEGVPIEWMFWGDGEISSLFLGVVEGIPEQTSIILSDIIEGNNIDKTYIGTEYNFKVKHDPSKKAYPTTINITPIAPLK